MIGILGKKIGMTQIFDEKGHLVSVTLIVAGPCPILQVKTKEADGYSAIQMGFGEKKAKGTRKPDAARFKKAGTDPVRFVRELRMQDVSNYKLGQKIEVDVFAKGDFVDVTGTSIGRGFQGGVRRWNWSGGDAGHGSMFHRAIGSIQSGPRLSRVTKGHHMAGHMGVDRVTIQNLEVMDVDKTNNLMLVKGAVPGHRNSFLVIREAKKRPKGYVKHKVAITPPKKGAKAQMAKK